MTGLILLPDKIFCKYPMNLFKNLRPLVIYECSRGRGSRVVYWGSMITYNFYLGLEKMVKDCEAANGTCSGDCELKRLLEEYSGGSQVGARRY
jgi:hypothetical protein